MNLIDTTAHFYSDVCPQLAKYYVTIQLAEKHLLSKKHLYGKLGAKYHVTISVFLLSLILADLTTQISSGGEKLFISLGPLMTMMAMTMMAMTMMTMMTMLMMVMMTSKVW